MMKDKCVIWGTGNGNIQQQMAKEIRLKYDIYAYCNSNILVGGGGNIDSLPIISPEDLIILCLEKIIDCIIVCARKKESIIEIKERIDNDFPRNISVFYWDDIADSIENDYLLDIKKDMQYHYNVDFENQTAIWVRNFMSEVDFWSKYVANPKGEWYDDYVRRLNNTDFCGLDKTVDKLAQMLEHNAIVMDIGCGLLSMYGQNLPNSTKVRLMPLDPLAPFYNKINQKTFNINGTDRQCLFGMFEFMANFYPPNYADAIIINNALDHCIDPYKSLIECLYILKVGGKMHLRHRRAEAIYEKYHGLHKWNLDYDQNDNLIFWNSENAVNITESLNHIITMQISHTDNYLPRIDQTIIVDIVKTDDFKLEEFVDIEKERYHLTSFIEQIMCWIADNNKF